MQRKDIDAVQNLLERYLKRFDMAPEYDREEIEHWLLHDEKASVEQVVWTYVVEDPSYHNVTDFFSFYCLESSVIGNQKHDSVRAAYLFYYATETAFAEKEQGFKERLTLLMTDALILAKRVNPFPSTQPCHLPPCISQLTYAPPVQLRRLQRPHPPRQPALPRTTQIRRR